MKQPKQRRLEAAGWKVSGTKEFLGLSDEEAILIEMKLELASALRTVRARRRLTQDQVSRVLRSSQSRVAKMESGDPSVSLDLLVRSLLRLGATRVEIAKHVGARRKRRAA
jgi:DNA-binding XRE family transcriptional regulator